MRIGIDVSQAVFGTGVSDYTLDLTTNLPRVDPTNEYRFFASSLRRGKDLKRLFPQSKLFHLPPMFLDLLWNRLHIMNIENFIGDVDVFHSSDWTEPPASSPKVTTIHDLSPFLFPSDMASGVFRNISQVHRARMHWVVKESKAIICVSNSTAADLQRLFNISSSRLVVIPEALPSRFAISSTEDDVKRIKRLYDLSDYLLTIGTPQPRKNISRLVSAYLTYKDKLRLPDKLVVVGGHGWGTSGIQAHSDVVFTGYLPDTQVRALLAGSSAFVFPSLHEGFGLPVLNAFFHRVPVITSNRSALPEVAGPAAILVDPTSSEAIAHGIQAAINQRKRLIAAGLKQLTKFSWTDTAKKTLMVYSQVC